MTLLEAIVLGLVQGLTEFLPISSTGHLILLNQWFHFGEPETFLFDIVIQLGAISAILVVYWGKVVPYARGAWQVDSLELWKRVLVAVLPALVLGFLLSDIIREYLFSPFTVALALIVGGVVLIVVERQPRVGEIQVAGQISLHTAFKIGAVQCLALIPGTSRSGASIVGGMLLGLSRKAAAEFSFLLAVPTMLAASGYGLLKYAPLLTSDMIMILLVGFVAAFVVALVTVRVVLRFIETHSFAVFGWYRIVLGVVILMVLYRVY